MVRHTGEKFMHNCGDEESKATADGRRSSENSAIGEIRLGPSRLGPWPLGTEVLVAQ